MAAVQLRYNQMHKHQKVAKAEGSGSDSEGP